LTGPCSHCGGSGREPEADPALRVADQLRAACAASGTLNGMDEAPERVIANSLGLHEDTLRKARDRYGWENLPCRPQGSRWWWSISGTAAWISQSGPERVDD
jgi:hypothetical protein